MTVDQIAALTAVFTFLNQLGSTSILTLFAVSIIAPWVVLVLVSMTLYNGFKKQASMYENNVIVVEQVITALDRYDKLSSWTISEVSQVRQAINDNMHCPIVREKAKPKDINYDG